MVDERCSEATKSITRKGSIATTWLDALTRAAAFGVRPKLATTAMRRFDFNAISSARPSGLLYHYTPHEGLLGIFTHEAIWASKIQYMNDSQEFSYAFTLFKTKLKSMGLEQSLLGRILDTLDAHKNINMFVASFSENGDLLSQWRAYCPESGGVSIGFNHALFQDSLKENSFMLGKCEYDPNIQDQLITNIAERSVEALQNIEEGQWDHINHDFMLLACFLKHPLFSEEKEWRAVSKNALSFTDNNVNYRVGKSMLVPYYEIKLSNNKSGRFPIETVLIGPTPHQKLSVESVVGFLYKKIEEGDQCDIPSVETSKTPYRAW